MTDDDDPMPGYELVMPFVVCASNGGPYDDDSFVAGYELGRLDRDLAVHAALEYASLARTLRSASLDQADLIAMRHGYRMRRGGEHDGEWTDVDFIAGDRP